MKELFPFSKLSIHFLDNAASTQKPQLVLDAMQEFYSSSYANVHRGLYSLAVKATEAYEQARKDVAKFMGCKADEVVFTSGTTDGMNLLANSYPLTKKDVVICSELDHHSTLVPWQQASKRAGATFKLIPSNKDGSFSYEEAEKIISEGCSVLATLHISNVTGEKVDIEYLAKLVHEKDGVIFVDGAQAAANIRLDVTIADAYCVSGHKAYGPTGIGALYLPQNAAEKFSPFRYGGEMVDQVTPEKTTFQNSPHKFEAGTPPIAQAVGMAAAFNWLASLDHQPHLDKQSVIDSCLLKLAKLDFITLIGHPEDIKHGAVSFLVEGIHAHDVAEFLSGEGVCVRAGHHCCQVLHDKLNVKASCRASFALYNTIEDVDALIDALKKCKEAFDV